MRAWNDGYSNGFGPFSATLAFPISNRNYRDMATLGIAADEILYYDYGETQDFYVLVNPPASSGPNAELHIVSPQFASRWFGLNGIVNKIYNPFDFDLSKYPLSTVV